MVAHDVADDRQSQPGAAGVAGTGPVHPVEALEDPVEVAARHPDAVVGDEQPDDPVDGVVDGFDEHLGAGRGVLDGVVEQVEHGRHQLASVPHQLKVGGHLEPYRDAGLLGGRGDPALGLGDDGEYADRLELRVITELDPAQLEQVVHRPADPVRLDDHPGGEPCHHLEVRLTADRLGQQTERPDRGLELVGDVGDEVTSDGLGAPLEGPVLDHRQCTVGPTVGEGVGGHDEGLRRRAEQVDHAPGGPPCGRLGQELLHGCGHQHPSAAGLGERGGRPVAEQLPAISVPNDHTVLQLVHCMAEPLEQERVGVRGAFVTTGVFGVDIRRRFGGPLWGRSRALAVGAVRHRRRHLRSRRLGCRWSHCDCFGASGGHPGRGRGQVDPLQSPGVPHGHRSDDDGHRGDQHQGHVEGGHGPAPDPCSSPEAPAPSWNASRNGEASCAG